MRSGVIISAVGHVGLVALALLGTPKLFEFAATNAIEVDLVRPDEFERPKEKPPDDKPAPWDPLPDKSPAWPEAAPQAQPEPQQPATKQAAVPSQPSPAPSSGPAPPQSQQPRAAPSIFDPANIPALLDLPNAPDKGFDAEATTTANLSSDDRTAFRTHLKKCWRLPSGMTPVQTTRVVLRVYLKRDGALASEPLLIEASASRDGPLLMQAAMRALKDCQPYGFLPADKYREWRMLDLSFSPRDMASP